MQNAPYTAFGMLFPGVEASGDNLFAEPLLWVHILAGVVALLAGIVAIMSRKGGRRHDLAGRLYVVTMGIVVVTAFPLSVWTANWFLFAIALFTGYLIASGYRVVVHRRVRRTEPTAIDYTLQGTMGVASIGMVIGGIYGTLTDAIALGEVLLAFGLIGGILAVRELAQFRSPPSERTPWFERHIAYMGGGYIATVTATVTVNLTLLPPLLRWLGPTVIGVPLILYAVRVYRPRFGSPPAKSIT